MRIIKFDKEVASVEFSKLEIKLFINSITEVLESLKGGFIARMNFTVEQVKDFLLIVVQWSEQEDQIICLDLLVDQVEILNNSLNEVCHGGVCVDNFQSKIGSKEEVNNLLDAINKLMNKMYFIDPKN